ncbi:MAG TPA: OB-fold domain-containing protein, partial [Acidimicrobiia bacterium]|nr:OB-fold domain-containing protein [Acidimicrobiia bacterium]
LAGTGVVYSFALLHYPQHPAFTYPVIAVLVDLDEGVRVLSNLVDIGPADVHIGLEVEVAFEPTVADMAVPVFRPRDDR